MSFNAKIDQKIQFPTWLNLLLPPKVFIFRDIAKSENL